MMTATPDQTIEIPVDAATELAWLLEQRTGEWQERALCAQTDPEAFFPDKGGSTREAKRICLGCEVQAKCLEYALDHDERFGIWGGLSERERRRLRKGDKNRTEPDREPAWTTREVADYLGINYTDTNTSRRLRGAGLTPLAGRRGRWNPDQVRSVLHKFRATA